MEYERTQQWSFEYKYERDNGVIVRQLFEMLMQMNWMGSAGVGLFEKSKFQMKLNVQEKRQDLYFPSSQLCVCTERTVRIVRCKLWAHLN